MTPETRPMKTQVYDRFGGGLIVLIVLIMLTIAVVAGQAQPTFDEPGTVENIIELDRDLLITIDHQRLEEAEAPEAEIVDSDDAPVQ